MAIRFTISQRGLLPNEQQEGTQNEQWQKSLRPQMEKRTTVDAVEFQGGEFRLPSMLPKGELYGALDVLRRVMLHEMQKGNAVTLPGIGTFRLSLKGGIEIRKGNEGSYYHGRDVHVSDILFEPDREMLHEVRSFEVDQVPFGMAFHTDEADVQRRLDALFAQHESITHKDVALAFEGTLSRGRVTTLLQRLVADRKLAREGRGAQTRYRKGEGW